jgi:hypothetical protein
MIQRRNLNDGKDWSEMDIWDLRNHVDHGASLKDTARLLCRTGTEFEVAAKATELGLRWKQGGRRRKPKEAPKS